MIKETNEERVNNFLKNYAYKPLRNFIMPFLAPLFTIANYFGFIQSNVVKDKVVTWETKILLLVTLLYFFTTFYFAVWQVVYDIKNYKKLPPSSH